MTRNIAGQLNPDIRQGVQRGVMQRALQILHQAWPAVVVDDRISASSKEDEITNVLRREMSAVKKSMKPPPEMRFEREAQSDAIDDDADLGLIDIMVCYTWNEGTNFVIECKRIWSTDNTLALNYVRDGTNRFAAGKYSAGHAFGAMAGYVLCGNRDACIERIQSTLAREPATETGFDREYGWKWNDNIVPNVQTGATRHHQRSHSNRIELIHLFLLFE